ncbi:MAG: hypothetical protein HY294_11960 [Candidatus Rokubacteria bacterium]|nr:hypothetical protein [Candidatus Rokubacteria bacterium]
MRIVWGVSIVLAGCFGGAVAWGADAPPRADVPARADAPARVDAPTGATTPKRVDPPALEERAAAIERSSKAPDGDRVVVGHLSRKLGVPVETLRMQRARTGLGWGDLLIANRLAGDTGLPVEQLAAEFRDGGSWTAVARAHGGRVEALIQDVGQTQEAVERRSEDRAPRTDVGVPTVRPGSGMTRPRY